MEVVTPLVLILSGFLAQSSSSQFHLVNQRKSWTDAQSYCRETFSDLASIHHGGDNRRLLTAAHGRKDSDHCVWIGLYDQLDTWKLSEDAGLEVKKDSLEWHRGQPNNLKGSQHCVFINKAGVLNDYNCETRQHFICYDDTSTSRHVLVEVQLGWLEAQSYCRRHHTDLASLRSREEQEHIRRTVSRETRVWVGLYRDPWASWSDRSASNFTNWNSTQPGNRGGDRRCAGILLETGKWVDESCDEEKPFFCFQETRQKRLRVKIRTATDVKDEEIQQQILKQLRAHMLFEGLKLSRMFWGKIHVKDEEENGGDGTEQL